MPFVEILNTLLALVTILFGAMGWLAPAWTMERVDLRDTGSTMGLSEVRAASGALFVVAGIGALLIATPTAFAMLGCIWLGGALGRGTSLIVDGRTQRKWGFFGTEVAVGLTLLTVNLGLEGRVGFP
ncbi:hypothetical protein JANAI62_23560 [Jannaschia pagri]|uniref:DUF4345 domain-containing protein n=1 Tax=Jannaschia pagri TaxID=2829797 RepID=A0ABQ4NMX6_9RHOB|nr:MULTISPECIES: DUF4345 family protein [unclassified Jannaschia]GIT91899.1 hypothetical protein JANAI61_23570 [Jannaschia sp. AI_61]GIT95733.1 hypothetical protein JANAI62_23560 [Jannaschia sp. AI_62]